MNKNKKLKLDELKVQSFVTDLNEDQKGQVKGASGNYVCDPTRLVSDLLGGCIGASTGAMICTRDSC